MSDTEWLFYTCNYSGIVYGDYIWEAPTLSKISEKNEDKKISMREYNDRTFYYIFNNNFPVDVVSQDLNPPPIRIWDSTHQNKISRYNFNLLPDAISVTSRNSVSMLTTPYDYPNVLVLNSNNSDTKHTIMSDISCYGRGVKRTLLQVSSWKEMLQKN